MHCLYYLKTKNKPIHTTYIFSVALLSESNELDKDTFLGWMIWTREQTNKEGFRSINLYKNRVNGAYK